MNRPMDLRWIDYKGGQMNLKMDRLKDGWRDKWMGEWVDLQIVRRIDRMIDILYYYKSNRI